MFKIKGKYTSTIFKYINYKNKLYELNTLQRSRKTN